MTNVPEAKRFQEAELVTAMKADPPNFRAACPVCGGVLIEIRHKRQCSLCHTICETCCEGGRG